MKDDMKKCPSCGQEFSEFYNFTHKIICDSCWYGSFGKEYRKKHGLKEFKAN